MYLAGFFKRMTTEKAYAEFLEKFRRQELGKDGMDGYIVAKSFVTDFEKGADNGHAPSQITNKKLMKKKDLKKGLVIDKDYIVVTEEIWKFLHGKYKGGPIIRAPILEDGTPELYPLSVNINGGSLGARDLKVSRGMKMEVFHDRILEAFKLPTGTTLTISPQSNSSAIYPLEGTISSTMKNAAKILISCSECEHGLSYEKEYGRKRKKGKKGKQTELRSMKSSKAEEKAWTNQSAGNSKKPPGLPNLGNTCYMNASLQAMMCVPSLAARSQEMTNACEKSDEVCNAFLQFSRSFDPRPVKKVVGARIPMFKGSDQHDAHEFVTFFLDMLHDESPDVLKSLFFGKLETITQCIACGHKTIILEDFSTLSLSMRVIQRVTFVPYNNRKKMRLTMDFEQESPCIYLGDGSEIITRDSKEYKQITALECPDTIDDECYVCLLVMKAADKKSKKTTTMLIELPNDDESYDLYDLTWERIKDLWPANTRIDMNVTVKGSSALSKKVKNVRFSERTVIVNVPSRCVTNSYHFFNRPAEIEVNDICLEDLVNAFFTNSQLDSENKWTCDECKQSTRAHRRHRIQTLPCNIILHLKRFTGGDNSRRDNTMVAIPRELTLVENRVDYPYDLRAVIDHSGTVDWGHYTAVGRRGESWYQFDDQRVSQCSKPKEASSSAYILFYSKSATSDD